VSQAKPVMMLARWNSPPRLMSLCAYTALANRAPFRRSIESLRADGVAILLGPGGFQPHPLRSGEGLIDTYPLAPRSR
jgi:hypothetical protein